MIQANTARRAAWALSHPVSALQGLALERGVERLGHRVIRARADLAHRSGHTQLLGHGVVVGGVLTDPWSAWKIAPVREPRSVAAASRASVTSSVRMWSAIDQPTSRRENQSITVAR